NSDLTQNPDYPLSNQSKRSILNSTLGYWDTTSLTNGDFETLLLVVKDKNGRVSFDAASIKISSDVDSSAPQIAISSPVSSSPITGISLLSTDDTIPIIYALTPAAGHKANVT